MVDSTNQTSRMTGIAGGIGNVSLSQFNWAQWGITPAGVLDFIGKVAPTFAGLNYTDDQIYDHSVALLHLTLARFPSMFQPTAKSQAA